MTDNEIIKAIEHCSSGDTIASCVGCPIDFKNCLECNEDVAELSNYLVKRIVDLINRQKAEIERLQSENKLLVENNISTKYPCHVLTSLGVISTKTLDDYDNLIGDISAEAVKEFAERLQNRCAKQDGCLWQSDIGAELNEFLGDKKNE